MGKIKKKGTSGQAKNFITRTQAVRKLQVSLPDFRRLCIFKGIYPREPRNKRKASKSSTPATTFYYTRDIQFLLHEPLLQKFREHKAVSKKIARALGRNEANEAARWEKRGMQRLSLDHIIKERYPTFVDALRDLDDALSLLFLFASLPSTTTVPPKTIARCQRLCAEFQHYIIVTRALRKSFLSIKGIYYQATIQGQDVLWLVPYKFVQRMTGDIDFRIMGTFVEFYQTLLGFVNFRLYTSIGLVYPPRHDAKSDEQGGELHALKLEAKEINGTNDAVPKPIDAPGSTNGRIDTKIDEQAQRKVEQLALESSGPSEQAEATKAVLPADDVDIEQFHTVAEGGDDLPQPHAGDRAARNVFSDLTMYLSRETPRQPLEFLLRSFGCTRIAWDEVLGDGAFTHNEGDRTITHQIVDRPVVLADNDADSTQLSAPMDAVPLSQRLPSGYRVPGRIYVQPQWVWDCVNAAQLQRADLYAPGATLPPHLSPWIKPDKGVYDPTAPLADQEHEGEAEIFAEEEAEARALEEENAASSESGEIDVDDVISEAIDVPSRNDDMHGMDVELGNDDAGDAEDQVFGGFDDAELEEDNASEVDEEAQADAQHQAELEAEAMGRPLSEMAINGGRGKKPDAVRRRAQAQKQQADEELQRRMGLMSRKKRKTLERVLHSRQRSDVQAETLRKKRRKLEAGQVSIA